MKATNFEDLLVWQKAQDFYVEVRKDFKSCKDFDFLSQLFRATLSISNNIAEGFERKTNNEFKYFLYISKGSCGEVRSMLYLAKRMGYVGESKFLTLKENVSVLSKMLNSLIRSI